MKYIFNSNMWDKKVIIYGVGLIFERYKDILNWDNIVAIVDMDINKQGNYINKKKIEAPEKVVSLYYDYVVIFTNQYFENAKINLMGNFFVPEQKIVSWKIFFNIHEFASYERAALYKQYIEDKATGEVIDIGEQQLEKSFLTNEAFTLNIDNFGKLKFQLHRSFYRNCYDKDSTIEREYSIVLLWEDYGVDIEWDCLMRLAQGYIIWTMPYSYKVHKNYSENIERLEKWGEKKTFLFSDAIVYVFEKNRISEKIDCEIFVVMHKRYNVLSNNIYKPICVGNQYENKKFYSEHLGENISYLNDRINECTALYWIWKNTTSEYVGLNHYRRYFYNSEIKNYGNYLTEDKIAEIFRSGFDIILPKLTRKPGTRLETIINSVGEELNNRALHIIRKLLKERSPMYVDAFEYVISRNAFYKCQMFITRRALLDSYCEWLFSFLIDAAKMLDVSLCDMQQKRTIGYFAETMLTVWLLEQNIKVKELPVTDT